jgi:hypothetical protein
MNNQQLLFTILVYISYAFQSQGAIISGMNDLIIEISQLRRYAVMRNYIN